MQLTRIVTSVVGVSLILLLAFRGGWYWVGFVSLLHLLAALEIKKISEGLELNIPAWPAFFSVFLFQAGAYVLGLEGYVLAGLVFLGALIVAFLSRYPHYSVSDVSGCYWLGTYLGLFSFLVLLLDICGWQYLFAALFINWASDTAAFYIGSHWGKHHLAADMSPHKTWEGAIAGFLAAGLVGIAAARLLEQSVWVWISMALLASVAGQTGDLFESALKRKSGLKDSGRLLPGHGGILDRFDSLLFVVPLLFFLFRWLDLG